MSLSVDYLLDKTNPCDDGTATTNQGLRSTTPVLDNGGGKANPGAAGKRTAKAHFTPNDCVRLIHARTILDHHYNQQINSAQTKMQFVTEKYNDDFDVPDAGELQILICQDIETEKRKF